MEDRVSSEGSHTHGDHFQVRARFQHHGILSKSSFSADPGGGALANNGGLHYHHHHASSSSSSRWAKRFFVLKDSFLMYYGDGERKNFEKRGGAGGWFNMRPKGVVPLGGSSVYTSTEPGQDYVIHITSDEFQHGHLMLAAETRSEMERWVHAIGEASRITWNNCQLAETMLRDLEAQGYSLNKEKHVYYERLQQETAALQKEIDKNQELEEVNVRLDQEKLKLEQAFAELTEQLAQVQRDYDDVSMAISIVEEDRQALLKTAQTLQASLEDLEKEKKEILRTLGETGSPVKGRRTGGDTYVRELQACLDLIEEERLVLLKERDDIQCRYETSRRRKQKLEDERTYISDQSDKLMTYSTLMRQNGESTPEKPGSSLSPSQAQVDDFKSQRDYETAVLSLDCLESILLKTSNLSDQFKSEIAPKIGQLKDFFGKSTSSESTKENGAASSDKALIAKEEEAVPLRTPEKMNYSRRCQTLRMTGSEPRNSLTALVARNSLRRDPKLPGKYHTMKLSMSRNKNKKPALQPTSLDDTATPKEVNVGHRGESYC